MSNRGASTLLVIAMVCLYLILAQALLALDFPGKGKLKIVDPPSAGRKGRMIFYFKAFKEIEDLTVSFKLPRGLSPLGDPLIRKIGAVPLGKVVKVPFAFKSEDMGIFRVSATAAAYDKNMGGGKHSWYEFFEAGLAKGYAPIIKPYNEWQKRTTAEPSRDEFVEVAKNVYKSNTRASDDRGNVFELDRFPVLPSIGSLEGSFRISGPPLIDRKVNMSYHIEVKERLGRRHAPAELVLLFPPNAFRIEHVEWPEGGDYRLIDRGFVWKGLLDSKDKELSIKVRMTAERPGEGKIRALFKVKGRRDEYTLETPLFLEVNEHSARVFNSRDRG